MHSEGPPPAADTEPANTPAKVGFIGLGRMGAVMAPRIIHAGHALVVWNRDPTKSAALADLGASVATSAEDLFQVADMVLMMTDTDGTRAVLTSVATPLQGKIIVLMGTFPIYTITSLCALVQDAGGHPLEAPVLGTVGPAAEGRLVMLLGGDSGCVQAATPVLGALARRIVHTGPVGSASAMKLAHNLLLSNYWLALGETLALGTACGLTETAMLDVLVNSAASNGTLEIKLPVLLGNPAPVAFTISGVARELTAICDVAEACALDLPVARRARDLVIGMDARGQGDRDVATIARASAAASRTRSDRV